MPERESFLLRTGRYDFLQAKKFTQIITDRHFGRVRKLSGTGRLRALLDSDPYTLENGNGLLRMVSGKDPQTGLQFTKEFTSAQNGKIRITYSMSKCRQCCAKDSSVGYFPAP